MRLLFLLVLPVLRCVMCGGAEFDIKDEAEFGKIVPKDATVQKLASDMKFLEGPVWVPDGNYLLFSDVPGNEIKKWSAKDGLTTFRSPSNNTNGNFLDLEGRLISCEHSARRVSRTEKDGKVNTLVDSYNGGKLNSPNDVVCKSDGTIWFTDPPYGLPKTEKSEQPKNFVFRYDPKTQKITAVADDFDRPNGLCFSPDEKKLYIADSGKPKHIRVFDVKDDGTLSDGKVFCVIDKGAPDGIRVDADGRMYSSAGEGVQIFTPDGKLIAKILVPESPANVCFGGEDKKTLYMTSRKSLYSIKLLVAGAQKP